MARTEVSIDPSMIEKLRDSFASGLIVDDSGPRPKRLLEEQTIGQIGGLTISIFADEHPPPHFCVEYQGESASFSITDCRRLPGNRGLERYEKNIRRWWRENRAALIARWNNSRPTDCLVGPVRL